MMRWMIWHGELEWAHTVLHAFDRAGGEAIKLADGEFIDLPVANRARRVLELAGQRGINAQP